jgi:hypothetical protein
MKLSSQKGLAWIVGAVLLSGCGSGSSSGSPVREGGAGDDLGEAGGSSSDDASSQGDAGGQSGGDAASATSCPSAPPKNGASCALGGGPCTFADNPRPACRTLAVCTMPSCSCGSDLCQPYQCPDASSTWSVGSNVDSECSPSCPDGGLVEGAACSQLYAYCPLSNGTPCGCYSADGGSRWICLRPPTNPQCPTSAPPLGSPCSEEGLACGDYDVCVTGSRVVCKGGLWKDNGATCPF